MKIKKILSVLLTLCLFVNVSFAFDPYADEEVEKKSYKKLYYGIALTLLGGFLAYDGFSLEKVDVSKPSVDFLSVSHSEWVLLAEGALSDYQIRSGIAINNVGTGDYTKYEVSEKEGTTTQTFDVKSNVLYNNGNVKLEKISIEVRYKFDDNEYIGTWKDKDGNVHIEHIDKDGLYYDKDGNSHVLEDKGYHIAQTDFSQGTDVQTRKYGGEGNYISLDKGESIDWQDIFEYSSTGQDMPNGSQRNAYSEGYDDGMTGLNLGEHSAILMEVKVELKKNQQYKPIYETRHKSDLEGVAGVFIGIAGIYFIIDHFFDMHKFNAYAKRHNLKLGITTASNQYKLMLQKRI